jgi:hypothetical protein
MEAFKQGSDVFFLPGLDFLVIFLSRICYLMNDDLN